MRSTRTARLLAVATALLVLAACKTGTSAVPASQPTYPTDPKVYAQAALDAWTSGGADLLSHLATPAALGQFQAIKTTAGTQWNLVSSHTDGGTVTCLFRDTSGNELTALVHTPTGGEHQVTGVSYAPTAYPSAADAYTMTLVTAWQQGNGAKLLDLAGANIADWLTQHKAPAGAPVLRDSTANGVIAVRVTLGKYDFTVEYTERALGKSRAVKDLIDNVTHQRISGD